MKSYYPLSLIGSGGHCKVVLDAIHSYNKHHINTLEISNIVDINYKNENETIHGYWVIDVDELPEDNGVFISIGDNQKRKEYFDKFSDRYIPNIIHSQAIVSDWCQLGRGVFVNVGSILNADTVVGDNVIINTGAIVDHDCVIGKHSHIAPGVKLAGRVKIGENCLIGIGTSIIQGIHICDNVIIGAGSVVTRNIDEPGTYFGSPARKSTKNIPHNLLRFKS